MPRDIQFILKVPGMAEIPVSPYKLRRLGTFFAQGIQDRWRLLVGDLVQELEDLYARHNRERADGTEQLSHRLAPALRGVVERKGNDVAMAILDMEKAAIATSDAAKGEPEGGWFTLVEDDHDGLAHGSKLYGWLPLDLTLHLADRCGERLGLDGSEVEELKSYARDSMAGRHGDGIMVLLTKPVFFKYPGFGTAEEHGVHPHLGFTAWNVFRTFAPRMAGRADKTLGAGDRAVIDAINLAAKDAVQRLADRGGR